MTQEGIREAFQNLRDGAQMRGPRRRRPLPQRERLADRHQRHPRADEAHVRLPRRQRRLGRPRADPHPRDRLRPRARDPQFQAARLTGAITADFEVAKGTYEGVYQRPDFKKSEDDEHDRDRPHLGQGAGRGGPSPPARASRRPRSPRRRRPAPQAVAPPLRPDHPPARGEQPLRPVRPPHLPDRPGALRAAQDDHLPAHRLARAAGGLHPDLPAGAAQPAGRPGRPRQQGAGGAAGCGPNKRIFNNAQISDHFAIIPTVEEPKPLEDMEAKIYDMIARRFVAVFHPSAEFDITTRTEHRRRPRLQDRGQGAHLPRLARGLRQEHRRGRLRRTRRRCPPWTRPTAARRRRRPPTPSSTRRPRGRRRATRRRRSSPPWRAPASWSRTRSSPRR